MPKKYEKGTIWDFSTSIVTKHQKIEGWGKFENLTMPKKNRGDNFIRKSHNAEKN